MSFWEALALVGTMATILGVFMTIYGIINNRTLKEEARNIREILLSESKNTKEILLRIEQGQNHARSEMAEAIRYVADLVRVEGEKTREAVRAKT